MFNLFTPGPGLPPPDYDWWIALLISGFSFVGGLLGSALRSVDKGQPFKLALWLLEGASAAFVSTIVLLLGIAYGIKLEIVGAICGVTALMGARVVIRIFQSAVFRKWKITTAEVKAVKELTDEKPD